MPGILTTNMDHGDKISHVLVQRINVADMIANRGVERMKSEGWERCKSKGRLLYYKKKTVKNRASIGAV